MKAIPSEVQKYLRIISETPQRIGLLVKGLDESCLQYKADAKSWSVNDIFAHLRSCADLWTHSIYAMLAEKEPVFSDIDERKWARVTRYSPRRTGWQSMRQSIWNRSELYCEVTENKTGGTIEP